MSFIVKLYFKHHQFHVFQIFLHGLLNRNRGYKQLWAEQTFRLFIFFITVISRRKKINDTQFHSYFWSKLFDRQGHQCSSLRNFQSYLKKHSSSVQNLQISLRKFKFLRYVTFRSRWSCDIQFHKYAVHMHADFL